MSKLWKLTLAAAVAAAPAPTLAATNVMTNWSLITVNGVHGVLRAGSPWGPGSTASLLTYPVGNVFEPEGQQWNNGSFWWDQDPSVNASPLTWEVQLNQAYTVNQFLVQADDNDSYLLEYWDGAAWQSAFAIPFSANGPGLRTRDSGVFAAITTDRFRFTATGGDNYYSVSEIQAIQAFAVPEPSTWALMIIGFGLVGNALRRRRRPGIQLRFG